MSDEVDADDGWTEEDDAAVAFEGLPRWHPTLFLAVFWNGLQNNYPVEVLSQDLVTPESIDSWGDFSRARELASCGLRISRNYLYPPEALDVAYVRLVDTDRFHDPNGTQVPATVEATLVWRPEIAKTPRTAWRVHHIGEPLPPDQLPRTAPGVDPRNSD